jgi:hypothetical protein
MTRKPITLLSPSDFVPTPSALGRVVLIVGLGAALIVLADGLYRADLALQQDRRWWACPLWILLIAPAIVLFLLRLKKRQITDVCSGWYTALLITAAIVPIFIAYVEFLLLHPATLIPYDWEFLDKRWIVALYSFSIITIYLPAFFRRIIAIAAQPPSAEQV